MVAAASAVLGPLETYFAAAVRRPNDRLHSEKLKSYKPLRSLVLIVVCRTCFEH